MSQLMGWQEYLGFLGEFYFWTLLLHYMITPLHPVTSTLVPVGWKIEKPPNLMYLEVRLLLKFKQDSCLLLKFKQDVSFLLKLKVSLVGRLPCIHFTLPTHLKGREHITPLGFAANFETCFKNSLSCVQRRFPHVPATWYLYSIDNRCTTVLWFL
jgi:hypothetical protein